MQGVRQIITPILPPNATSNIFTYIYENAKFLDFPDSLRAQIEIVYKNKTFCTTILNSTFRATLLRYLAIDSNGAGIFRVMFVIRRVKFELYPVDWQLPLPRKIL